MSNEKRARDKARDLATQGVALLARAVNHLRDPAVLYRYGAEEQARFMELAGDLVHLVETGRIELSPAMAARYDQDFQAFLNRTTKRQARLRKVKE
jgi:aspartate ammonia-lyase